MCAKLLGSLRLVRTSSDCGNLEAYMASILQSKMAKAADAEDRNKVARFRGRVAQRAEGRQASTQQRRRVDGCEIVRHGHQAAGLGDHHLGIAAVVVDTRERLVLAAHQVAVAAGPTVPAAAAEKSYADALADFPPLHPRADRVDATHRLVTGDTRPLDWKHSFDSAGVRMADPARPNANADMARVRIQ